MARVPLVLGMLLALHSLGLIFVSLLSSKWYISDTLDVGIFSICNYTTVVYKPAHYLFGNMTTFEECIQLLWPDSNTAENYLATKPTFLTGLMGVGIASAALGFLTFMWASICIVFKVVGRYPRSCELLLVLSVLTDMAIVTTFAMFLGKDERLYAFEHYGYAFWCSVGAACGYFVSSILFAINRIHTGFSYKFNHST